MLKNLPSLLTPDALHALASMGHGDELAIVDAKGGERAAVPVERFDFYQRASQAAAIFRTGEQRTYGNLLLRKGVVV